MEAVEEPPLHNPPVDALKISVVSDESDGNTKASVQTNVCHKPNGVAESSDITGSATSEVKTGTVEESKTDPKIEETNTVVTENNTQSDTVEPAEPAASEPDTTSVETIHSSTKVEDAPQNNDPTTVPEETTNEKKVEIKEKAVCDDGENIDEAVVAVEHVVESTVDRVTFQTEIVVESNDSEVVETVCEDTIIEGQENHILSELGENIVLSEALRSSDVTDNVENNNCSARQEVFNKEELLDILEGNNEEETADAQLPRLPADKILEAQLALQQLTRIKNKSRINKKSNKPRSIEKFTKKRSEKMFVKQVATTPEIKKEESIVTTLVKEWDDEGGEEEKCKALEESENLLKSSSEELNQVQESVNKDDESIRTSVDSQTPSANKSGDEGGQPQRRLGRVIKKKVIFDPDNPDTFTKSKLIAKNKGVGLEKGQTVHKKLKTEQTFERSKSKSPLRKLQWKKPSPKNSKQYKRLTEIDKLLMDEGAVNMIYQLTPEAPKGKGKNMKTKAEFIKKIQSSSTPDTKEMKFRERKKECRYEEGEARKILGGKQRPSLNSSVKSPSVSEDFEAHSADDSIIYRRHSSSSYSSSCMSPRRLSDVEMNSQNITRTPQQMLELLQKSHADTSTEPQSADMFMSDGTDLIRTETINKDDCLSIKEKLNSKLNLALNKRKRENSKTDKPSKQKKVVKDKSDENNEEYKHLSIRFDGKLAVICVQKPGSISDIEIIKELENALKLIELIKDISVTLFTPQCAAAFSDLDLRLLLDDNNDNRTKYAYTLAEAIRSLLQTVEKHSKLLCVGINVRCTGIGLALIGLSDVSLASECASFAITAKSHTALVEPGVSVLTTYRNLPQSLVTDLMVFGRRLSASEALQNGLVSRTLYPDKFNEQVLTIAKDIAAQPAQNIWVKKQLLSLKKSGSEFTFQKRLEKERDLFVEYWTSVEGQELLRATYNAV